jgi:hypothetical protein
MALYSIIDHFADYELELNPLLRLRDALVSAEPVAMLMPPRGTGPGRRRDRPYKQRAQGMLAGMVRLRQDLGEAREQAAWWVAQHCPRVLEQKLAPKEGGKAGQLTKTNVLEWLDRYGGRTGDPGSGRDAFLLVESLSPILQAAAQAGDSSWIDKYMQRLMNLIEPTLASK